MYARTAVPLLALVEARANQHAESTIVHSAAGLRALHGLVQTAPRDTERSTESSGGKGLLRDSECGEFHPLSFAKKAAALGDVFLHISSWRTFLRSSANSAVFFVTLAMNIFGTGVIRDFAFAMNVGVVVGTYSSIFVASPILIWLNERAFKTTASCKAKAP